MAIIKAKKMREINEKELDDKMKDIRIELSREKGSSEIGTVKNPGRIRELRKTYARILTEKHRRQMSAKSNKLKSNKLKRGDQKE